MPTLHIGHDDHISGFELTEDDLENLLPLSTNDEVNDYAIGQCERVEVSEADLFLNMMDKNDVEFEEFMSDVRFWLMG